MRGVRCSDRVIGRSGQRPSPIGRSSSRPGRAGPWPCAAKSPVGEPVSPSGMVSQAPLREGGHKIDPASAGQPRDDALRCAGLVSSPRIHDQVRVAASTNLGSTASRTVRTKVASRRSRSAERSSRSPCPCTRHRGSTRVLPEPRRSGAVADIVVLVEYQVRGGGDPTGVAPCPARSGSSAR